MAYAHVHSPVHAHHSPVHAHPNHIHSPVHAHAHTPVKTEARASPTLRLDHLPAGAPRAADPSFHGFLSHHHQLHPHLAQPHSHPSHSQHSAPHSQHPQHTFAFDASTASLLSPSHSSSAPAPLFRFGSASASASASSTSASGSGSPVNEWASQSHSGNGAHASQNNHARDFHLSTNTPSPLRAPHVSFAQQQNGQAQAQAQSYSGGYHAHQQSHLSSHLNSVNSQNHTNFQNNLHAHQTPSGIPMSYSDEHEYEHDGDGIVAFASMDRDTMERDDIGGMGGSGTARERERERTVRRRSSKACDQCRKSKCKCERAGPGAPCKNCIMLGTPCTFLGPSRKRGPPKGYIDAIEARLHQTEALLGIILRVAGAGSTSLDTAMPSNGANGSSGTAETKASAGSQTNTKEENASNSKSAAGDGLDGKTGEGDGENEGNEREGGDGDAYAYAYGDERARGLLDDIAADPLAREIIARVDNSPYGVKGRKRQDAAAGSGSGSGANPSASAGANATQKTEDAKIDLASTHPSTEWQDRVAKMLEARAGARKAASGSNSTNKSDRTPANAHRSTRYSPHSSAGSDGDAVNNSSTGRRTRRRVGEEDFQYDFQEDLGYGVQEDFRYGSGPQEGRRERSSGRGYADEEEGYEADANMDTNTTATAGRSTRRSSRLPQLTLSTADVDIDMDAGPHTGEHPTSGSATSSQPRHRRLRRRDTYASNASMHTSYISPGTHGPRAGSAGARQRYHYYNTPSPSDSEDQAELEGAVGQLSLNEDEQVRYHGTASGLHLLAATGGGAGARTGGRMRGTGDGVSDMEAEGEGEGEERKRRRGRREDGIWRFPKARVWPPLPSASALSGSENSAGMKGTLQNSNSSGGAPHQQQGIIETAQDTEELLLAAQLPPPDVQAHLLALYFAHVQPVFPIVHKKAFWDNYNAMVQTARPYPESPQSPDDAAAAAAASVRGQRRRGVSTLLLLAMFALASRYDARFSPPQPPPRARTMWTAGDEYLDLAKVALDRTYAGSRAATCQALLLMGFREIGIGAMAQAWCYIGMGIRMAQDLGMHRSADGWAREEEAAGAGAARRRLFGDTELNERKRIWYGCVIMDKYVSTYIGRPLMIFEWDFDTPLPDPEDEEDGSKKEEWEEWIPETPVRAQRDGATPKSIPVRSISCFNASATLSGILGNIVQNIYAVRPVSSRHAEYAVLEGLLDRWYLELPEHLRFDPASATLTSTSTSTNAASTTSLTSSSGQKDSSSTTPTNSAAPVPPPNVLTLHMQYWCAVLLLHRPFIRQVVLRARQQQQRATGGSRPTSASSEGAEDQETRAMAEKSYELCNAAANHITSIVSLYQEKYLITQCSVFLCYYVFTASIMHDTNLAVHPNDPQARLGLSKCMSALRAMRTVWPSAARALDLFGCAKGDGSEDDSEDGLQDRSHKTLLLPLASVASIERLNKRAAEHALDDSSFGSGVSEQRSALHLPSPSPASMGSPFSYMAPTLRLGSGGGGTHQHHHAPQHHGQQPQNMSHLSRHGGYDDNSHVFASDTTVYLPPPSSSTSGSSLISLSSTHAGSFAPTSWQGGGDIGPGSHGFNINTPLSTAVLPQLYSTGLVDDDAMNARVHGHGDTGIHGHGSQQHAQQHSLGTSRNGRYPPQYFDYASYPSLGSPYDISENVQQQQQQQQQQQGSPSQMYLPDQYGLYNNQQYNNR